MSRAPVYPDNVFERWALACPEEAERHPDPRVGINEDGLEPLDDETPMWEQVAALECRGCEGQGWAWRGYDGLCGWCKWFEDFGEEESP